MRSRFLVVFMVSAMCAAIIAASGLLPKGHGPLISPAYAASMVTARQVMVSGQQAGEVLVNDQVVFRIRTSAGGLSPYQRAQAAAQRLQTLVDNSLKPTDITTGRINGQYAVMARGKAIVTADAQQSRLNGTTSMGLANSWAARLENVLAGRTVTKTPIAEKVVPIISVGSGIRVGGALVSGASNRLSQVVAVAQLEGNFGNSVRVRALIPVSTTNVVQNIRRVPETSVIGLVDISL